MTDRSMRRWQGRVALVTGASAGIGVAVARALAEGGMKVAICGRREDRLKKVAASCTGSDVLPIRCDMRDERAIGAMFETIRARWGGVDVLINNAGLGHKAPLTSGKTDHWREMLDVNVLGLCICTREAISDMRGRGDDGYVIHVSSMAAHRVPPGSGVYSASKFAVRSLTEALRQELREAKSQIRVAAISPGFVETEFAEQYSKSKEAAKLTYGRYKVLESEDIADAVTFVLSSPPHMAVHDVLIRPRDQIG